MQDKARKLRWGILATGGISHAVAKALAEAETGELYAIGSRSQASADAWGIKEGYPVQKRYGQYEDLLADPAVDAVYISTPNHAHAVWTVRAAEAGKHILCEKPFATNYAEAMVMVEACRRHQVFLLEAFMWRCHPGTARWLKLLRDGEIGEIRHIEATFGFNVGENFDHSRLSNAQAAGGIQDVGCYTMSAARAIAGAAAGADFAEPEMVMGAGQIGRTGVDEWAAATLRFPGGVTASLACGVRVNLANQVRVFGSKGNLLVKSPWFADGKITVAVSGQPAQDMDFSSPKHLYTHEVDMLGRCVREGRVEAYAPAMTWADTLGQQAALDKWRKAVGVIFEAEKEPALRVTLAGRPLHRGADAHMPTGRIAGLDKPVSRVVMGSMVLDDGNMPFSCALLDDYFERGGNAFDSAFIYGARCEKALGKWMALRGVREEVVILGKGAHTAAGGRPYDDPGCDPKMLVRQLEESLQRLGTDYLDVYCMHRDNPKIPVGEFVDVLNQQVEAGRVRVFGGSNWTRERLDEANAWAAKHGKRGFGVVSNNYSLAQWNEPMWGGCVTSSEPAFKAWLVKNRMPLFAWSSQASGFFTGRFKAEDAGKPSAAEVARVWFNAGNFERLARARLLAAENGVDANQIALAYVLGQPLEMFAVIGPRAIEETRTSLGALGVTLSSGELAWLNLEAEKR